MSEARLLLFDVTVALVAFVGGNALLAMTDCGRWAATLGMLPFGCWLWYRDVMPNSAGYSFLGVLGVFTVIDIVQEVWWPNQPENFVWIKLLIGYAGIRIMRRQSSEDSELKSNEKTLSHA